MEKEVFISNGTREDMKNFSQILEEKFGIKSRVDTYIGKYLLYVDENDYLEALSKGSLLAEEMGLNFSWLDKNNTLQPLGYISVMYQILPNKILVCEYYPYLEEFKLKYFPINTRYKFIKFFSSKERFEILNKVDVNSLDYKYEEVEDIINGMILSLTK